MEYNSVDKVFAEKLRDIEKTPSADMWSRLQERQQVSRQKALFPYARVACVAALFVVGNLAWQSVKDAEQATDAKKQVLASQAANNPVMHIHQESPANLPSKEVLPSNSMASVKVVKKLERVSNQVEAELPLSNNDAAVASSNTPAIELQSVEPTLAQLKVPQNEGLVVVVNIATEQSRIERTNENDEANTSVKKKSKAGKLFQQLRKVRNGEKVNWKELGISSESVLALVKDGV